jgi:hypothetical protein
VLVVLVLVGRLSAPYGAVVLSLVGAVHVVLVVLVRSRTTSTSWYWSAVVLVHELVGPRAVPGRPWSAVGAVRPADAGRRVLVELVGCLGPVVLVVLPRRPSAP